MIELAVKMLLSGLGMVICGLAVVAFVSMLRDALTPALWALVAFLFVAGALLCYLVQTGVLR